jgi:hypothetical protein
MYGGDCTVRGNRLWTWTWTCTAAHGSRRQAAVALWFLDKYMWAGAAAVRVGHSTGIWTTWTRCLCAGLGLPKKTMHVAQRTRVPMVVLR